MVAPRQIKGSDIAAFLSNLQIVSAPTLVGTIPNDGVTDASTQIKAAHDAAKSAGIRQLYFPVGSYYAPNLRQAGDVMFVGQGNLIGAPRKYIHPFALGPKHVLGGVIPKVHLAAFIAATNPVVNIVGDSTVANAMAASVIPASWGYYNANATGKLEGKYGRLKEAISRDNPDKAITFNNWGIGGTAWTDALIKPALTLPPWYTDTTKTWDYYWTSGSPDLIVLNWSTNNPLGTTAVNLNNVANAIAALPKVPSVVVLTGTGRSRMVPGDDETVEQPARDQVAQLIRTFAQYKGWGVIDDHRQATLARDGYDECLWTQELRRDLMGSTIFTLYNFPEPTVDFDLGCTFTAGTTALPSGGRGIDVAIGRNTVYNYVRLTNSGGNFAVQVNWENGLTQFASPVVTTVPVPTGQMSLTWSVRNNRLLIETYVASGSQFTNIKIWEGPVVRYGGFFTPRIKTSDNSGPLSFVLDVLSISRPTLYMPEICDYEMWGDVVNGSVFNYTFGGNDVNHQSAATQSRIVGNLIDRTTWRG